MRSRYRTTDETALVGESLAGLLVVETFFVEPELFDTYVAVEPSLWWNRRGLISGAAARLRGPQAPTGRLYLATGDTGEIATDTRRLADVLRANAPAGLRWQHVTLPGETHATIFHPAALGAFRALFKPAG